MELALKLAQVMRRTEKNEAQEESEQLLREIREINREISRNEGWFSEEMDEDLIDSCVYQGQALRARYRYLMRMARQKQVCAQLFS